MTIEHRIRDGRPGDVPFIVSSWLKSYWYSLRRSERQSHYWEAHKEVIATLLETSECLIAEPLEPVVVDGVEKHDVILGYAIGEPQRGQVLLHYAYTKQPYRRLGVARSLVQELIRRAPGISTKRPTEQVVITHCTSQDLGKLTRAMGWGFAPNLPFYRTITARRGAA